MFWLCFEKDQVNEVKVEIVWTLSDKHICVPHFLQKLTMVLLH